MADVLGLPLGTLKVDCSERIQQQDEVEDVYDVKRCHLSLVTCHWSKTSS